MSIFAFILLLINIGKILLVVTGNKINVEMEDVVQTTDTESVTKFIYALIITDAILGITCSLYLLTWM